MSIAPETRHQLLALARRALEARVLGQNQPGPQHGPGLDQPCGVFVTIHHRGELRGCLGRLESDLPAGEVVAELGADVADSDPRFSPVRAAELPEIDVEISLLMPAEEVASIEAIDVGRHGLIVEQGMRRGLLLPQVASERGWDRETFLEHTCIKAGLPRDAWRHGARILMFEATVFGETDRDTDR